MLEGKRYIMSTISTLDGKRPARVKDVYRLLNLVVSCSLFDVIALCKSVIITLNIIWKKCTHFQKSLAIFIYTHP